MLGEGDQKRQATVGNVTNVIGMRTRNITFCQLAFVAETHLVWISIFLFLCLVDESLKKMPGFASRAHRDLSLCLCVHESARVT